MTASRGAPPPGKTVGTYPTGPRLFADVDYKHTELTGVLDNTQNVIKLHGCFEDRDLEGALGASTLTPSSTPTPDMARSRSGAS